ncbi:MAG: DUF4881 domain-containing protein [Pseudomonadota bacterium]
MIKKLSLFAILAVLSSVFILACGELGKVDQGRVIEFDKEKGTVTIIRDKNVDPKNPDYSYLPPVVYELPKNPSEMGEEPKTGKRMKLDTANNQIVIFDPATQDFKTITYKLIEQKENVGKEDSLVFDREKDKPKNFPLIDKGKKTITIYSKKQKILVTFSLPDEYFALPDNTWDNGDEARIYYKEEGKARRFMNVSKIDIFKK